MYRAVDGIWETDYVCGPKLENNFGSAEEMYRNTAFRPLNAMCIVRLVTGLAKSGLLLAVSDGRPDAVGFS
jgi:hypothetical protein